MTFLLDLTESSRERRAAFSPRSRRPFPWRRAASRVQGGGVEGGASLLPRSRSPVTPLIEVARTPSSQTRELGSPR